MESCRPARLSQAAYAPCNRGATLTLVSVKQSARGAAQLCRPAGPTAGGEMEGREEEGDLPCRRKSRAFPRPRRCCCTCNITCPFPISLLCIDVLIKVVSTFSPFFFHRINCFTFSAKLLSSSHLWLFIPSLNPQKPCRWKNPWHSAASPPNMPGPAVPLQSEGLSFGAFPPFSSLFPESSGSPLPHRWLPVRSLLLSVSTRSFPALPHAALLYAC